MEKLNSERWNYVWFSHLVPTRKWLSGVNTAKLRRNNVLYVLIYVVTKSFVDRFNIFNLFTFIHSSFCVFTTWFCSSRVEMKIKSNSILISLFWARFHRFGCLFLWGSWIDQWTGRQCLQDAKIQNARQRSRDENNHMAGFHSRFVTLIKLFQLCSISISSTPPMVEETLLKCAQTERHDSALSWTHVEAKSVSAKARREHGRVYFCTVAFRTWQRSSGSESLRQKSCCERERRIKIGKIKFWLQLRDVTLCWFQIREAKFHKGCQWWQQLARSPPNQKICSI